MMITIIASQANRGFSIGENTKRKERKGGSAGPGQQDGSVTPHSFTQQAILYLNESRTAAADEERRRHSRPDVVPREKEK